MSAVIPAMVAAHAEVETNAVRDDRTARVRELLYGQLHVTERDPRRQLGNDASLINDWRADSLDLLHLTIAVEDAFATSISDEDAEQLDTVKAIVDRLMSGAWS
jgi:acyl carrier protein